MRLTALDFSPGFTWEQYAAHWEEVRRRKSMTLEVEHRRRDGSVYPAEVTVNHVVYAGAEYLFAYDRDITERKAAERALQESESRFRHIVEHTAVGIAQVTLDFHIEHANQAFCRMLGLTQTEIVGKHLRDITHPDSLPENLDQQARLGRGEIDHYAMEKRFIHRGGHTVYGILNANLIRDAAGSPAYFLGSVLDITRRIHSEQALKESAEKFRQVFEHLGDGVLLGSADSTVLEDNPAAATILGYDSPQHLVGLTAQEIVHPDDLEREGLAPAMQTLRDTGVVHLERRYRHARGGFLPVAGTVSRTQDTGTYYVVFRDISIQKGYQQQLEHLAHLPCLGKGVLRCQRVTVGPSQVSSGAA